MSWSYRVMKSGSFYTMHEVYYKGKKKKVKLWSEHVTPIGESIEEIREDLTRMLMATYEPIVEKKVE